jgi:two-component system nitrogen regulation response regulator GlnG
MDDAGGSPRLLLVDDDPLIRAALAFALESDWEVLEAGSRAEALAQLDAPGAPPLLALVDLGLPPDPHAPGEGLALITDLADRHPRLRVLVLTGQQPDRTLSLAYACGAVDFLAKPVSVDTLRERLALQREILRLEARPGEPAATGGLIGESPPMQALRARLQRTAESGFPVLVTGESGTGKELVARALHEGGPRREGPFLAINCAALAPQLIEAQLFGHARGAFTGAATAAEGLLAAAGRGTLLLDEIGELPTDLQAKLLRVLESGEYFRLGETTPRQSEARIVAATNRDLMAEVRAGRFREDLYHRISVLTLALPPLRERGEDILLLFEWFRAQWRERLPGFLLEEAARTRLLAHPFPGNVRELRNLVVRLATHHAHATVGVAALEAALGLAELAPVGEGAAGTGPGGAGPGLDPALELGSAGFDLDRRLREIERAYLDAALRLARGNLSRAARLLGLHRTTLYSRLERYGVLSRQGGE